MGHANLIYHNTGSVAGHYFSECYSDASLEIGLLVTFFARWVQAHN